MSYDCACIVDDWHRVGVFLDDALHRIRVMYIDNERAEPVCNSRSSRVAVPKLSTFPSSSKPMILIAKLKAERLTISRYTCLSLETPFIKQTTQGKTWIPSFSTRNGTFSTKTRKNLVLKYFGARA